MLCSPPLLLPVAACTDDIAPFLHQRLAVDERTSRLPAGTFPALFGRADKDVSRRVGRRMAKLRGHKVYRSPARILKVDGTAEVFRRVAARYSTGGVLVQSPAAMQVVCAELSQLNAVRHDVQALGEVQRAAVFDSPEWHVVWDKLNRVAKQLLQEECELLASVDSCSPCLYDDADPDWRAVHDVDMSVLEVNLDGWVFGEPRA